MWRWTEDRFLLVLLWQAQRLVPGHVKRYRRFGRDEIGYLKVFGVPRILPFDGLDKMKDVKSLLPSLGV